MNKEESDLIIAEQNKSTEEILKAVAKVKSDYHELCKLKDMRIAELEEKISVLLSCKNCPENKGGFICVKEYENKCLAQKIQFIKELKEENENLKKTYRKQRNKRIDDLQKENAELKEQNRKLLESCEGATMMYEHLTKAKELLKQWVELYKPKLEGYPITPIQEQTEQFLNSEVEK